MLGDAVELIEEADARGARAFREWHERRLTGGGARPGIAWVTGEHEAVDDQRILAVLEQIGQLHLSRLSVCAGSFEDIVRATCRRQRLAGGLAGAVVARFGAGGEDALVDFAERAGRNEEIFREVNEKIDEGVERHGVASAVPYH